MNLKDFIKDKKLEIETIGCNFTEQNYGHVLFNTGYIGKRNTMACIIFDKNLEITFFDNTISWINDDEYTDIFEIRKNGLCGIIDPFGKEIIPCTYDSLSLNCGYCKPNMESPIWVSKDKKEALFDRKGNQLTKLYDNIEFWSGIREYFIFQEKDYSGVIDSKGNELFRLKWANLNFLTNTILIYKDNFEYGLIDINGKILTEAQYEDIKKINENSFLVVKQGRCIEILNFSES